MHKGYALDVCASSGSVEKVEALVELLGAPAVRDWRDELGSTILHYAACCWNPSIAVLKAVLAIHPPLNAINAKGFTALHLAHTAEFVDVLLAEGCLVGTWSPLTGNPLHFALHSFFVEGARRMVLWSKGLPRVFLAKSPRGLTPLGLALLRPNAYGDLTDLLAQSEAQAKVESREHKSTRVSLPCSARCGQDARPPRLWVLQQGTW